MVACGQAVTTTDSGSDSSAADVAADDLASDSGDERRCNGLSELCDRPLNQVAFVTTHNSMANEADGFAAPNQTGNVTRQLTDGVRAFMLDIHYDNTQDPPPDSSVFLCHGYCIFGIRPLEDTMVEIKDFLQANPGEFVAIIFESYVDGEHVKESFDAAGVTEMLVELANDQPMPTMGELIDAGRRILVLTDEDGDAFPGYLPVWDWAWDNDWDNKVPEDLNCRVNRGGGDNNFFILNHFLTDPVASEDLARKVNFNPFLIDRVMTCQEERGHIPNFVTVDFYHLGDVIDVVSTLNRQEAWPEPGVDE